MAEYLFLIYETEDEYATATPALWQEVGDAHRRFAQHVTELGGTILADRGLEPTATATTVRNDLVTDGPFVETKETFGGFYLVRARDLDHALAMAKLCPARFGGVEVRPVKDVSKLWV